MTPLELEEMVRELRESRPVMDPKISAELDEWAAKGFPRGDEKTPSRTAPPTPPRPKRGGWLAPAFAGGFALLLLATVIGLSQLPAGEDDSGTEEIGVIEDPAVPPTSEPQVSEDQASQPGDAELSRQAAGGAAKDRVTDEQAGLTLSAEEDQVGNVTDDAALIVQRYDGIVDEQTVSSGDGRDARGHLTARVPIQNFNAALSEISDLGTVKARNQGLTDITKPYVSAEKRFANAKERVNSLRAQVAGSDDPALEEQLRFAEEQLAAARASLRAVKQEGNFADLTLGVVGEDGGWSIGDAADDAVGIFEWIGGALLVTLAVLIPATLVGAALWFGTRSLRRRRRESVLDD